jgi:hypothetical protein
MTERIDMDAVIAELRKGWTKDSAGDWRQATGKVCLLGACRRVAGAQTFPDAWEVDGQAQDLLRPIIREHFPDRMTEAQDVADFNDNWWTTLDDVLMVLEKARAEQ